MSTQLNKLVSYALDNAENPEEDALALFHHLMERFAWSGTVMTRADAETMLGRELTEEEWDEVCFQKVWRDAPSIWNEHGITWDCVQQALDDAGIEGDDD